MDQVIGRKDDSDKLLLSLIPTELTEGVGEVLTFGAKKYAPNNWKQVDNAEQRYMDALLRHLLAYQKGEKVDPESGFSHLKHIATNVAFLLFFENSDTITKEA